MKVHPFTLAFHGELEEAFQQDYFDSSIGLLRASFLLGAAYYTVFAILDAIAVPEASIKFALIRFAFVCPVILTIFLLSFTKTFRRWWQLGAWIATVVSGLGIVLMTFNVPALARTSYYPGMMLVLFYCYMLIKLRFVWATLAGWIIVALYLLSLLLFPGLDYKITTINLFFLISANILGMFGSYALEYYTRRDFFFRDLLSKESEKIALTNRTLQERVNEQTKELQRDIQRRKEIEQALHKQKEHLNLLIDNIVDVVWQMDLRLNFTYVSPSIYAMTGYTQEEWIGTNLSQHAPGKEYFKMARQALRAVKDYREFKHATIKAVMLKKNGEEIPVEIIGKLLFDENGLPRGLQGTTRDISARARAEKQVEKHLAQLQALREIERAITSTLEVDQILSIMMTELQGVIPHDSISVQMLQDHALEVVACHGFPEDDQVAGLIFPLDPKFPNQRVVETQRTLAIEDITRQYPHFKAESGTYRSGQIRSWMGSPLVAKDHVIGMIALDRSEEKPFSDEEIQLVEAFANQAAIALENARLFLETERRLAQLNTLRHIDKAISGVLDRDMMFRILLGQIITQLEADAACVLLYDPQLHTLNFQVGQGFKTDTLRHTSLRLGEGYAGKTVQERRTIQLNNIDKKDTGFLVSPHFKQEGFKTYFGVPLIAKGQILGVLEVFHRSDFHPDQDWKDFLDTLAGQVAIAIDNLNMFSGLQKANQELNLAYNQTLEGWARALEYRDMETEGHSRRVTDMTVSLARTFGIQGKQLIQVRRGALLHDIGKMAVPDDILQKPGSLDDREWQIIRQHPVNAYEMLKPIDYLRPALDIPHYHHEKWDGSGYPDGLEGEQIPIAARIFAVVDVWDALTSDRPYRDAWPEQKALEYIREQAGQHFDPQVVDAFLELIA